MRAILAVAGLVLLTALVLLGVRGSGDSGDPTALDAPTESPAEGSTAAGEDSDPLEATDGPEDATPSPTEAPPTDQPTDAATDDEATEPDDVSGGDSDDTDAEPAGDQAGDSDESSSSDGSGDTGSDGDGSAADDVDDMPDTGVAGILPLTGLVLTGLALRLRR